MSSKLVVKKSAVGAFMLFLALWIIPPIVNHLDHRCPVRSNGLNNAEAVPAFARKYGVSCSQCHSAFPTLNAYGREFKLSGYVRAKGSSEGVLESKDGQFRTEKLFPWGVVVRSRLFDKARSDTDFSIQPISDVDFFVAGGDVANQVSWFGELDANADNDFAVSLGDLQLGYHPSPYVNLLAARRGFFVMDPYQTLSNFGSPTVGGRAISGGQMDQGSFSKEAMDETAQTLAAFGRVAKKELGAIYYAVGESAENGDNHGKSPKTTSARIALSNPKDSVMVGAFGCLGHQNPATTSTGSIDKIEFSKIGVDAMVELGDLTGRAAFLSASDKDVTQSLRETNRSAYAELMYTIMKGDSDAPFLVPLIRQNWYQTADGTRQFAYFTAQLAHYFKSNVKAFVEYSKDTKQDFTSASPDVPAEKDNRVTVQAEVGF